MNCAFCNNEKMIRKKCLLCDSVDLLDFAKLDHREIKKCRNCNFIFVYSFDLNEIEESYISDYYASSSDPRIEEWINNNSTIWVGIVYTLCHYKKNIRRLLDVGAGTGGFLSEIVKVNPQIELYGTERSKNATTHINNTISNINMFDDVEALILKDIKFDAITLLQTLEHFYNPKELLFKINFLLDNNGVLFLTVPNAKSYKVFFKGIQDPYCFNHKTHLQFYTHKTLIKALKNAGFKKIIRINEFGKGGVSGIMKFFQWIFRIFGISSELRYIAFK